MRVIYIDVLFFSNLMIDYLLLLLSARLSGAYAGRKRLAAAAAVGALLSVVLFFIDFPPLPGVLAKAAVCLAVTAVAFRKSRGGALIRQSLIFLGVSLAFGGGILALSLIPAYGSVITVQNGVINFQLPFIRLFLSVALLYFAGSLIFSHGAMAGREKHAKVTVCLGGRTVVLNAFLDTGNQLRDPLTGAQVILVSKGAVLELFEGEARRIIAAMAPETVSDTFLSLSGHLSSPARLIPYRGAAGEMAFALAIRADRILVGNEVETGYILGITPGHVETADGCLAIMGV